jgi:hypothetical protein
MMCAGKTKKNNRRRVTGPQSGPQMTADQRRTTPFDPVLGGLSC